MKEIVYSFDEFKAKVDLSKPLHHHGMYECKDPHGIIHWLTFRMFGVSRNGGHVVVFEERHKINALDGLPEKYREGNFYDRLNQYVHDFYHQFVEKYAKPLGSTEGEWKE